VQPDKQKTDSGANVPAGGATDPDRLGDENGGAAAAGLDQSWRMARAKPADTPVAGNAIEDRRTIPLKRTIHAESEVACNEKPHPNKWLAIFQYLGDFAKAGGGLGQ
jgi:hypothetical protein